MAETDRISLNEGAAWGKGLAGFADSIFQALIDKHLFLNEKHRFLRCFGGDNMRKIFRIFPS